MSSWAVFWLLTLMVLTSLHLGPVQAKSTRFGARTAGKRLTGPSPIKERPVSSLSQCLALCARLVNCTGFNYRDVTGNISCQLFDERACPDHRLEADPAVSYYSVCGRPLTKQPSSGSEGSCEEEPYCSEEDCAEDCSYPSMAPPGAFRCSNGSCQTTDGFWEVRPGFALPKLTNVILHPWINTYKKLKSGICSLDIKLKLGDDASVQLKLVGAQYETRLTFRVTETTTDLTSGSTAVVSGADTTGMVNEKTFSQLRMSWCDGTMAIGPASSPSLVSGATGAVGEIAHLVGASSGPESYLQVLSGGVADAWLFEEAGTGPDPVFSIQHTMIARRIEPSVDVSVKYDCKAQYYCSVYLRSDYPEMLSVFVGAWSNTASGLAYNKGYNAPYYCKVNTGPILTATEFNTFTVRYNNGSVTVFRNDDSEPMYNVTAPTLLPPITSVGIGSMHWGGPKEIRVARYDPAWRTDTWITDGTGFSNMDTKLYAP